MITIQKDIEITRHPATSQYSIWISIKEDKKETDIIYIFSHVFRAWFLKTDEEVLEFIRKNIDTHLSHLMDIQSHKNKSIFDNIRYRLVFQISDDISDENTIGFTGEKEDENKIKSYYFQSTEDSVIFNYRQSC